MSSRSTLLGRVLKYKSSGIPWQANPQRRKIIADHSTYTAETRSLAKNGIKDEVDIDGELEAEVLQKMEENGFRVLAARANYMAVDVPNIKLPTKEVCRDMSRQSAAAYEKMKRVARCMVGFDEMSFE